MRGSAIQFVAPVLALAVAAIAVAAWLALTPRAPVAMRVPGTDRSGAPAAAASPAEPPEGKLVVGRGMPGADVGSWPQLRGPGRDGKAAPAAPPAVRWPLSGPLVVWRAEVGEGYAGPVVHRGRVYLMDYDRPAQADALRCLSLDDGAEIWRYTYPVKVKRNHGMSRTVPAVTDQFVVAIGPKCHVLCVDAPSGERRWMIDLVSQWGATVPPWYAGQCPLVDEGRAILAPGGEALLIAVDCATGEVIWRTPNPMGWHMTHTSIMPMTLAGRRTYVYAAGGGVVGVDAATGAILWQIDQWKIDIAAVASPVVIDERRIFLAGGYDAGSAMFAVEPSEEGYDVKTLFRLDADVFGATQQTPILHRGHIFGIRPDGQLSCLDLAGAVRWTSGSAATFGLGPLLLAGDLLYAMNDDGRLTLLRADPQTWQPLAEAQVLAGHESWGPMALAGSRLLVRDFTELRCLNVGD